MDDRRVKLDGDKDPDDSVRSLSVRTLPLKAFFRVLISIALLALTVYYFYNYITIQNKWARVGLWLTNNTDTAPDQADWDNIGVELNLFSDEYREDLQTSFGLIKSACFTQADNSEKYISLGREWGLGAKQERPPKVNYGFATYLPPLDIRKSEDNQDKCTSDGSPINGEERSEDIKRADLLLTSFKDSFYSRSKPPAIDSFAEHSDRMLEVFEAKDFIHEKYPELRLLWFYVGTDSGAFATYPGHILPMNFDPRTRPWYRSAMGDSDFKSQWVANTCDNCELLRPYIDVTSGMPVRTLWKKVKFGSADRSSEGNRTAIIGLDFMVDFSGNPGYRQYIVEFFMIFLIGIFVIYSGLWLVYQKSDAFFSVAIRKVTSGESWKSASKAVLESIRRIGRLD